MENRVWVIAALTGIAALGVWALEVGYAAQTEVAGIAATLEHVEEDVSEIKRDLEQVDRINENLIKVCVTLEVDCR